MAAPLDVNRPYAQVERCPLDIIIDIGGQRCRCLPRSKNSGGVHNGGTVGGWLGGVGGGVVAILTYPTLSSFTGGLAGCPCGTAWSVRVCQNNLPYMRGGAF